MDERTGLTPLSSSLPSMSIADGSKTPALPPSSRTITRSPRLDLTREEAFALGEKDEDDQIRRVYGEHLVCPSWINIGREAGCSTCRDIGYLTVLNDPTDDRGGAHMIPCHCQSQLRADKKVRGIVGNTELAREIRFETWRLNWPDDLHNHIASTALTAAQQWANGSGPPWLWLHGPPGIGKTHLAIAALRRVAERGEESAFHTTTELLGLYKAAMNNERDRPRADAARDEVQDAPWLVMDDMGQERSTTYNLEEIETVLMARYRKGMRTCITSNGLSNVSPRMLSRLGDRTMVAVPDLSGAKDVRQWL